MVAGLSAGARPAGAAGWADGGQRGPRAPGWPAVLGGRCQPGKEALRPWSLGGTSGAGQGPREVGKPRQLPWRVLCLEWPSARPAWAGPGGSTSPSPPRARCPALRSRGLQPLLSPEPCVQPAPGLAGRQRAAKGETKAFWVSGLHSGGLCEAVIGGCRCVQRCVRKRARCECGRAPALPHTQGQGTGEDPGSWPPLCRPWEAWAMLGPGGQRPWRGAEGSGGLLPLSLRVPHARCPRPTCFL